MQLETWICHTAYHAPWPVEVASGPPQKKADSVSKSGSRLEEIDVDCGQAEIDVDCGQPPRVSTERPPGQPANIRQPGRSRVTLQAKLSAVEVKAVRPKPPG